MHHVLRALLQTGFRVSEFHTNTCYTLTFHLTPKHTHSEPNPTHTSQPTPTPIQTVTPYRRNTLSNAHTLTYVLTPTYNVTTTLTLIYNLTSTLTSSCNIMPTLIPDP